MAREPAPGKATGVGAGESVASGAGTGVVVGGGTGTLRGVESQRRIIDGCLRGRDRNGLN